MTAKALCSWTWPLEVNELPFMPVLSDGRKHACYLYVALDGGKEGKLLHVRLTGKLTASAAEP